MEKISPQGYNYGSEPFQTTPFWGSSDGGPSEYVKNITSEKTRNETEKQTEYSISYKNQDDLTVELEKIIVPDAKGGSSVTDYVQDVTAETTDNVTTITETKGDGTKKLITTIFIPEAEEGITEITREAVETSTETTYTDSYKKNGVITKLKDIVVPVLQKIGTYITDVSAKVVSSGTSNILKLSKEKSDGTEGEYINFEATKPENTLIDWGMTPYTKSHWKQRVFTTYKGDGTSAVVGSVNDYFENDLMNDVTIESTTSETGKTYTFKKKMCNDTTTAIGTIEVPSGGSAGTLELQQTYETTYWNNALINDGEVLGSWKDPADTSIAELKYTENTVRPQLYSGAYQYIMPMFSVVSDDTAQYYNTSFTEVIECVKTDSLITSVTMRCPLPIFKKGTFTPSWGFGDNSIIMYTDKGSYEFNLSVKPTSVTAEDSNLMTLQSATATYDVSNGNYNGGTILGFAVKKMTGVFG